MSDQQNDWWTTPGATPPTQPAPPNVPAPGADPDATVVVPARNSSAPPVDPGQGRVPQQHAPQAPPPGSQPPAYGGEPLPHDANPAPQYGNQTPQQVNPAPQYGNQPPQYANPAQQYGSHPPQYADPAAQHGAATPHGGPSYGVPQFVEPAGPTSRYRAPGGSITMLVGAIIAIIGTFLPWVTFPGGSVDGYERYLIGDGFDAAVWNNPGGFVVFAMVIVIVSAVVVLAAGRRIATWIIALLAAGFGGLMSIAAFGAVGSVLNNDFAGDELGVGFGIALSLLGATISGIGALIVAAKKG